MYNKVKLLWFNVLKSKLSWEQLHYTLLHLSIVSINVKVMFRINLQPLPLGGILCFIDFPTWRCEYEKNVMIYIHKCWKMRSFTEPPVG